MLITWRVRVNSVECRKYYHSDVVSDFVQAAPLLLHVNLCVVQTSLAELLQCQSLHCEVYSRLVLKSETYRASNLQLWMRDRKEKGWV